MDLELTDDGPPQHELDEPAFAACYGAAARGVALTGDRAEQPTLRLLFPDDAPNRVASAPAADQPVAEVRGVNVHVSHRTSRPGSRLAVSLVLPTSPQPA